MVTDSGAYAIEAPTQAAATFFQGIFVSPSLPDVHIQWFMDDLHTGDKVLFAAKCDKHNNCLFWLPKPDQPGKEYHTNGWFRPRIAPTNTTQLCGTGKLSAAIEAQVCKPALSSQAPNTQSVQPAVVPAPIPVMNVLAAADAQSAAIIPTMACSVIQTSILSNPLTFKGIIENFPLTWAAIQSHCPTEAAATVVPPTSVGTKP